MPLPHTGQTAKVFASWVEEVLRKERHPCPDEEGNTSDRLTEVWPTNEEEEETRIAQGSEFTRTLTAPIDGKEATWTERVQVLQSLALLDSQKTSLEKKLQEAEGAVRELTRTGKGRKVWREENELAEAVKDILHDTDIEGLLEVKWPNQERTTQRYGRGGRPKAGAVAQEEVQTRSQINAVERVEEKIKERQEHRGWRVEVTNAPEERLSFEASVLTYHEGAGLERPFHQMKDEPLGIRPRFVRKDAQIQGLTRLVRIALRVLTLLEIVARAKVAQAGEKLEGMHEGPKNQKEGKPTGRRFLRGIARLHLTLSEVVDPGVASWPLPVLPSLLVRVLALLGLSPTLDTDLTRSEPLPRSRAPLASVPSG